MTQATLARYVLGSIVKEPHIPTNMTFDEAVEMLSALPSSAINSLFPTNITAPDVVIDVPKALTLQLKGSRLWPLLNAIRPYQSLFVAGFSNSKETIDWWTVTRLPDTEALIHHMRQATRNEGHVIISATVEYVPGIVVAVSADSWKS